MNIKCVDVLCMLVEEANEKFAPMWKIEDRYYKKLKEFCKAIDLIADEVDAESINVEIDEIKMDISITMESVDVFVEDNNSLFVKILDCTKQYSFSASENGTLLTKFVFPSIWVKA